MPTFQPDEPVSQAEDQLILVDAQDAVLGYGSKSTVHQGTGTLHRAFSVFLLDATGRVLLQQRSALKPLWPHYWANSCCSHPRRGETTMEAAHRRTVEELGLRAELRELFQFEYQASFGTLGSEHELCTVFVGRTDEQPRVDPAEVAATRWVPVDALTQELAADPESFTPWLHLEWSRIVRDHRHQL